MIETFIIIILTSICWLLAAICNALMDTLVHHFDRSIFAHLNRQWWDPAISWQNKYIDLNPKKGIKKLHLHLGANHFSMPFAPAVTDAWHLFKSLMVVLLALGSAMSVVFLGQSYFMQLLSFADGIYTALFLLLYVLWLGFTWVGPFNLFYNTIFIQKSERI